MPPLKRPLEPGWYDDPDGNRGLQRHWDGKRWAGAPRQRPPELKWSGILEIIAGTIILTLMIVLTTRSLL
jgi:hypothetical protein